MLSSVIMNGIVMIEKLNLVVDCIVVENSMIVMVVMVILGVRMDSFIGLLL